MANDKVGAAYGFSAFAAVTLLTLGAMEVLNGMTAIANSNAQAYLKTADKTYFVHLTSTGWGTIHVILGVLLVAAGFGVIAGQVWARSAGIVVAALTAVAGFGFVPIYPVWGVIVVALAVAVIWALTSYGRDLRD